MTDHLAEARRITEGQTAYDSTALSCGILHALIAIAERMGEPRPGVLLTTEPEPEPDPVADALDEMAARQDTRLLPAPQAGGRAMTARTSPETRAELARLNEGWSAIPPTVSDFDFACAASAEIPDLLADLADAEAEQERLTVALRLAQAQAAEERDRLRSLADAAIRSDVEARQELDALRAERDNLREQIAAMTDPDRLSIMGGWLVWAVGEHTCGGYGPESGYAHEPGCGYEPILDLGRMEGWPGAELDALAAKLDRVRALAHESDDGTEWEHVPDCQGEPTCPACWTAAIRRALDESGTDR